MHFPQLQAVIEVVAVHHKPEEVDGKHCRPDVVPEDAVGLEKLAVLLEEGQDHSPARQLVDGETE